LTRRPATRRKSAQPSKAKASSKVAHVVRLIDGLGRGLGPHDGAIFGRRIARWIADAYAEGARPVPRWVTALVKHYAAQDGHAAKTL
jgi:hypothetical protein